MTELVYPAADGCRCGDGERDGVERDKKRIDRIRERAYLLWERGDRSRDEAHYWLQAEREIDTDDGVPKRRAAPKRAATAATAAPAATAKPAKGKAPKDKPAKDKAAKDKAAKSKTPKPKPKPKAKETFPAPR